MLAMLKNEKLAKRSAHGYNADYSPLGDFTGRGSARLERTVRVREVGGSNPPAPTDRDSPMMRVFFIVAGVFLRRDSAVCFSRLKPWVPSQ
jgi:hypothetical protein